MACRECDIVEGIVFVGKVNLDGIVCDEIESPQPPFTKGGKNTSDGFEPN